MLEGKNINLYLKKDGRKIVDNFSFTLQRGDRAVLIGEEGNGKSTLLKFLYDRRLVESYCECEGSVLARGRLAYLPQSLPERQGEQTLAAFFAGTEYYRNPGLLQTLGLSPEFLQSPQTLRSLSGGEKVKAQLARLLLDEPDVLLLDEPTNDLDIGALRWLETFLAQSRLPVLFISHDETLIERTANVILHLEQLVRKTQCRISVARCPYQAYLAHRRTTFDHQEQVARKQRSDYDRQMEKWRQIHDRVEHEQRAISRQDPGGGRLLKKKMHAVQSMGKRFEREKENFLALPQEEEAILTRFDEGIRLPASKTVLDVSLDCLAVGNRCLARHIRLLVAGGEHVGITGRNGVGKSTLLAHLWRLVRDRTDIVPAYMPQNYEEVLDFSQTPVRHLAENYAKDEVTRARTYMGSMRFTHEEMTGPIADLSGGQKAKILFLDMVLRGANVLLLDEPTRNFSPLSGPVVRAALARFGGTILSMSHDRKFLAEVCHTVYELTEHGLRRTDAGHGPDEAG